MATGAASQAPVPSTPAVGKMDRLIERVRTFSRYGVWFGGTLMILAAVIVGIEVVVRKLFNVSLGGADELSGFALAISSAWAFGYALLERAHVRIDSVYTILPSRVCAFLDVLGLLVFTLFMGLMTWQAIGVFTESVRNSTVTLSVVAWPLRFPQFLWVAGLAWFVVIAVLLLVRAMVTLSRGEWLAVQLQIGSKTVREELDEELGQIEKRGET